MDVGGDQIAGAIGISLMLLMLVHRMVTEKVPRARFVRMTLMWAGIVITISVLVWIFQYRQ